MDSIEQPRAQVEDEGLAAFEEGFSAFEPLLEESGLDVPPEVPLLPDEKFPGSPLPGIELRSQSPLPAIEVPSELDVSAIQVQELPEATVTRGRRGIKRKAAIDTRITLPISLMKRQLSDVSDIVREPTLAPPTKKAMTLYELQTRDEEDLFSRPLQGEMASQLLQLFAQPRAIELSVQEEDYGSPEGVDRPSLQEGIDVEPLPELGALSLEHDDIAPSSVPGFEEEAAMEGVLPSIAEAVPEESEATELSTAEVPVMLRQLRQILQARASVSFNSLVGSAPSRRSVSVRFFQLLLLQTQGKLNLEQEEPYGDVFISM